MKRRTVTALLVPAVGIGLVSGALTTPARASVNVASAADTPITELIVSYEPGVTPSEAPGIATGDAAVASDVTLETGDPIGFGLRTVKLSSAVTEAEAEQLADELAATPGVASAEPNGIVTLATTQDPAPSWGLDRIDQASLPLSATYNYATGSTGAGVTAYVIDTGIKAGHNDFGARRQTGYVEPTVGSDSDDCNGHGTHVAGTIGGTTYGVAKSVTLVPVRVFACSGSTTISAVVNGINWVVSDHTTGPAVANLSLSSSISTSLDTAVTALINDGVTVVVAAGNGDVNHVPQDSCTVSPAHVAAAITVNASDSSDAAASFSNYGSCSDLYAPGVSITSDYYTSTSATAVMSGTSMASPHVAGAVARYLQANTSATPAQVQTAILAAASPVTFAPASPDPDLLLFASPGAATAPGAPTGVGAAAAAASANVSWSAPASDGGATITGYTASAYSASSGGSPIATCTTAALSCTISGLASGTTYYVDVFATNSQGDGTASSPRVSVVPTSATAPSAPLSVAATPANASAAASWSAPASNGGSAITGYTASAYLAASGGSSVSSCTTATLSCTISSLTNGTTYYVAVTATNGTPGAASTPRVAVTPRTVPAAPTAVSATAGEQEAIVSWTASAGNGGSPITSYTAQAWTAASGGSKAATCQPALPTGVTCTITGLTGGTTYYVDVIATNAAGDGSASSPRTAVTPTAPASGGGGGGGGGSSSGSSSDSSSSGGGGGSIWTVKEVRPAFGSKSGGETILVLGWGFTGATGVSVGGTLAPSFTFINDGTIQIVTPPGSVGWQELRVWLPNGSVPAGFEYRDIAPAAPPAAAPPSSTPTAPTTSGTGDVRVPVGVASSPVLRATVAEAAATQVARVLKAVSTSARTAPIVSTASDDVTRLRVRGVKKASTITVQVLIDGRYYTLGKVRSTKSGNAVLPAFVATDPGSYRIRLKASGVKNRYLTVRVR